MTIYTPAAPDKQQIRLRVMDENVDLTRWTQYSFSSHYLTPSDGWSMTIGDGDLAEKERNALRVGATVRLYVQDFPLAEGYIDRIEINADRGRGVTYSIHGRDRLAPVVDSVADPRIQFKTGTTLADFLQKLLAPYGWVSPAHFEIDPAANRDAKTGGLRGTPLPKRKSKTGKLSKFQIYQLKPHNGEGLFRFIQRTVERFGLFVRVSADGDKIIVAGPDFEQPPRYQLIRDSKGNTNILSGDVVFDATDQPSVILADGFSGGGEFGKGKIKSYCVNPYFGVDEQGFIADEVSALIVGYPEAEPVLFVTQPYKQRAPRIPPRPMFLHDEESKTQEQLNFFIKRTMSELLRKSLVCHYTVEGHGQTVDGVFTPWDVDTVVDVQDEVAGVHERMYVLGRTFDKSRQSGTTTKLELVRLYSIAEGEQEEKKSEGRVDNTKKKASAPRTQADADALWRDMAPQLASFEADKGRAG
jgi:prophage tail gpP-like protein